MKHHSTIFLDIETIPSEEKPSLESIKAPANYKNEDTIKKYQEENQDKEWRKQSLNSLEGRILCVGVACNDGTPVVFTGTEENILAKLETYLIAQDSITKIVAHNGMTFDYPFLFHRALRYGKRYIINYFNGSKRDVLFDTMKMIAGTDYRRMISLDNACKLIGVQGKGDIDGSMVCDYWLDGREKEIYEYCKEDVSALRKLYYALTNDDSN